MKRDGGQKPFDCVKSMHEIRNRIGAAIAAMSCSELSQWLDGQVGDDPLFLHIPKSRQPGPPPMDAIGVSDAEVHSHRHPQPGGAPE